MCWYSVDYADKISQAETGQRLGIRKVHGSSWIVRESDLRTQGPTPVCLLDRTTVLFRFSEAQQLSLQAAPEVKAVFHMPNAPQRDVFRFSDGREVSLHALPDDVIFDVLEVPGREDLSAVLKGAHTETEISETATGRKSMLGRVWQLF
jgi:hypothetical protein